MRRAMVWSGVWALVVCAAACSDPAADGTQVASDCVQSDLIAQCPPGSDPILDASATAQCGATGEANLVTQDGQVTGSCEGEGECVVLCQFVVPCACDVERIDETGVYCAECAGAVCEPNKERCNGDGRQICNLQGQWEDVACPSDERCQVSETDADATVCVAR